MNYKRDILKVEIQNKNGGNKTMSTIKKLIGVVGVLVMGLVMVNVSRVEAAYSDQISTNNTAGLIVKITPRGDRGVEISSGEATLDLGVVDMNFSTKTVHPATVTIYGNMSTTELEMTSTITAVAGSWSFDNDPNDANADLLAVWSVFSGVNISSAPSDNEFVVSNATVTQSMVAVADRIGGVSGNGTRFEGIWTGSDMDSMVPGTKRHLWVRMRTPASTSITGEQSVHFNLAVTDVNY
jgi:hypothetical protein